MDKLDRQSYAFRNCDKPTISPVIGVVKGEIPKWLNGTLTRNGPGIQTIGPDTYRHMFDGLAIIHRFHIAAGNVTYNNRPLESNTYHKNMATERIVVGGFGTVGIGDPCDTLFSKFKSMFISSDKQKEMTIIDNCNVNVAYYGDQLYAMTETDFVRRIDPTTLNTIGDKVTLSDYVVVNQASAHPHILEDGTVLNSGVNYKHKNGVHYIIIQVPPSYDSSETSFKNAKIIAKIPSRWKFYPGYHHSFGITKNKIIFIEQPYCISLPRLIISGFMRKAFQDALTWYPKEKTRIHVISMETGEIHPIVYETEKLFTFHHANAYEEDGHIVVDVSAYNSADFVNKDIDLNTVNNRSTAYEGAGVRRYVLPLVVSSEKKCENLVELAQTKATAILRKGTSNIVDLQPEILCDEWFELPRINYKYNGINYRYLYGASSSDNTRSDAAMPITDILTKLDTLTGEQKTWTQKAIWISEPVFVPNPTIENPDEDDGVVIANILHADDQSRTTLLVLDAKTMKEVATVEFKTDGPVTTTFHGQWAQTGKKVHVY